MSRDRESFFEWLGREEMPPFADALAAMFLLLGALIGPLLWIATPLWLLSTGHRTAAIVAFALFSAVAVYRAWRNRDR